MNQKQKEKFGEWLMDIAKYMLTAMVLASMLEYMKEPAIMVSVYSMATILTLAVLVAIAVWGLVTVKIQDHKKMREKTS